ncbi:GNAT family N-acetyltransferase [Maledivibacter halophilus]|uniref:Acetyltransferases n=1 Tax=Maledivibacter halophilus TaxID=36842 RepID=A0A1T5LD47_9FIRM|nr:GNAT family N-acetyltransferase [Maledivibacter halophilus]SKC73957.1 Acetyltransferases [Maledivibacter halophilus]
MIFQTEKFYVDTVEKEDLPGIVEIYNSNINFLQAHMSRKSVDIDWIKKEIKNMKEEGFYSCKIICKKTKEIIGIIDFSLKEKCYLSLIIIHNNHKKMGYGKEIYLGFEDYVKSKGARDIRIDVVTNYDRNVLKFWKVNGFNVAEKIELNWTGKILNAFIMKKRIFS